MATRLTKPIEKQKTPLGVQAWAQLLRDAIAKAEKAKDPRAIGMRKYLGTGQEERFLRRMGIVGIRDIAREFPDP